MSIEENLERIRIALRERNLMEVSRRSGISYYFLRKIDIGDGAELQVRTIEQVSKYLGLSDHGEN